MKKSVICLLFLIVIASCIPESEVREKLITQNCGSCHIVPDPTSLTAEVWEDNVFPQMADYFVWDTLSNHRYANKSFYHKKAQQPMTDELWSLLMDHFVSNALPNLETRSTTTFKEQTAFHVEEIKSIMKVPATTCIRMSENDMLWLGTRDSLLHLNIKNGNFLAYQTTSRILDITERDDKSMYILDAGVMRPHDEAFGSLKQLDLNSGKEMTLLGELRRPVKMTTVDSSIYISEFGHQVGKVSKFNTHDNSNTSIINLPGCYAVFEVDIDGDEIEEIIVQCSQALEGIYRINKNDGQVRKLIAFPPETGLSDLDIADVDNDGLLDFIVAFGDNADYSNMPKSYHGVRVFQNRSNQKFKEIYRFDAYGTTQIKALDLNGDHAVDLVASSYFPLTDQQSILVFEQTQEPQLSFEVTAVGESQNGRWMTSDTGDLDGDGDIDMVFAGYVEGPTAVDSSDIRRWYDKSVDVLILRNKHY